MESEKMINRKILLKEKKHLATKKTTGKRKMEDSVLSISNPSSLDKYRLPNEVDDHWEIRRMFIEKNFHLLAEDELLCLAQVFMNIELLGCRYPPETMELIREHSEGIASKYRLVRANMLHRTFVSASDAAAAKVQRKTSICVGSETRGNSASDLKPRPTNWNEILQNVIVINNSFQETVKAFDNLNCGHHILTEIIGGGIKPKMVVLVKIGKRVIGRAEGQKSEKTKLLKDAQKKAVHYLSEHCYSISTKARPAQVDSSTVASLIKPGPEIEVNSTISENRLGSENVGYKLMAKLGWQGGSLGVRGDGLVNPLTPEQKYGRNGLGHQGPGNGIRSLRSCKNIKKELLTFRDDTSQNELVFSSEFTKEERASIHVLAHKLGLKTVSHGKDENRYLVVSKAESWKSKLKKVLEKDPFYCQKFEVKCPTK